MGKFYYKSPNFKDDDNGNMEIMNKPCVGPIEVIIYGITKDKKFYFDLTYPEFYPNGSELKRDYRFITKEEMIEEIKREITICEKEGNLELVEKYLDAINMIRNSQY